MFDPPLPEDKQKAIHNLMFGTVDKIFLEYERPFLNPGVSEILLLWDDRGLEPDKQKLEETWFRKIYSFTKISETLLLGWISGRAAEYMETLSSKEISEACTKILRQFLNDPFVPVPKSCVFTTWHANACSRGSYTAMAVGASAEDIEILATPLKDRKDPTVTELAFAGEDTHSSFYSTDHGAYLSGRTAAQALLESRKKREKQHLSIVCEDTSDLSSWIQGISLN